MKEMETKNTLQFEEYETVEQLDVFGVGLVLLVAASPVILAATLT